MYRGAEGTVYENIMASKLMGKDRLVHFLQSNRQVTLPCTVYFYEHNLQLEAH